MMEGVLDWTTGDVANADVAIDGRLCGPVLRCAPGPGGWVHEAVVIDGAIQHLDGEVIYNEFHGFVEVTPWEASDGV